MRARSNPWPAFVDLFAALLIPFLAGFVMLFGNWWEEHGRESDRAQAKKEEVATIRSEVEEILEELSASLDNDSFLVNRIRPCGEDTCIDLYIHFDRNEARIADQEEMQSLANFIQGLHGWFESISPPERKAVFLDVVEIVVEGHADRSPMKQFPDARGNFLFNWNLSSERATAVLYEFSEGGIKAPDYQIIAIGYGDSQPICGALTKECEDLNRRTTLRLRVNTERVGKRTTVE